MYSVLYFLFSIGPAFLRVLFYQPAEKKHCKGQCLLILSGVLGAAKFNLWPEITNGQALNELGRLLMGVREHLRMSLSKHKH